MTQFAGRGATSGFVVRKPDPEDRRVKRIYLTKQAGGFMERLRRETDAFNASILDGISRKSLDATAQTLLKMKKNLLSISDGASGALDEEEDELEPKKAKRPRAKKAA